MGYSGWDHRQGDEENFWIKKEGQEYFRKKGGWRLPVYKILKIEISFLKKKNFFEGQKVWWNDSSVCYLAYDTYNHHLFLNFSKDSVNFDRLLIP